MKIYDANYDNDLIKSVWFNGKRITTTVTKAYVSDNPNEEVDGWAEILTIYDKVKFDVLPKELQIEWLADGESLADFKNKPSYKQGTYSDSKIEKVKGRIKWFDR